MELYFLLIYSLFFLLKSAPVRSTKGRNRLYKTSIGSYIDIIQFHGANGGGA